MARSRWKLKYFSSNVWRRIFLYKMTSSLKRKRFFYDRSSTIPYCFSTLFVRIHKGKLSRRLFINVYNVGYKFGEFSFTRKPFHFPLKKKKR